MSHLRMCTWHVPPGAATGGDCARDLRDAGLVAKGRARYPQGRAAGTGSRMRKTVDVVILGAGIAGLWTYARLRRAGYDALLCAQGAIGGGQTIAAQGKIGRASGRERVCQYV